MKIHVVAYNPQWPDLFQFEAAQIKNILGNNSLQIFHIGSTSVPMLKAKPIIDLMPIVKEIEKVDLLQEEFKQIGYEYMGEFGIPGRRYLRKGGDNRTHQIHIFQYDNITDILRHLAFRDYLRQNPDVCVAYGDLKSKLALQFPFDIEGYSSGKEDFITQVERDALHWYWSSQT